MIAIVAKNGRVVKLIDCLPEMVEANTPEGHEAVVYPFDTINHYYKNGFWKEIPERPSLWHEFNHDTEIWDDTRDLQGIQNSHWEKIKLERDELIRGGFEFLGKTFDSDDKAQSSIISMSELGQEAEWTLKDNSTIILSAEDLKNLRIALAQHIALCHSKARTARVSIMYAKSKEEIEKISLASI